MANQGYLTTHILDTAKGCPANNVKIDLYRLEGEQRDHLASKVTNEDGRTDGPILPKEKFSVGSYELVFQIGDYFGDSGSKPAFIDIVPIRFGISDGDAHYHVPLLVSPFSYSTYRGS